MSKTLHGIFAACLGLNVLSVAIPPYEWDYLLIAIASTVVIIGAWIFTWRNKRNG